MAYITFLLDSAVLEKVLSIKDINVEMRDKVSGLLEFIFYCQWWGEPSDNKQVNSVMLDND